MLLVCSSIYVLGKQISRVLLSTDPLIEITPCSSIRIRDAPALPGLVQKLFVGGVECLSVAREPTSIRGTRMKLSWHGRDQIIALQCEPTKYNSREGSFFLRNLKPMHQMCSLSYFSACLAMARSAWELSAPVALTSSENKSCSFCNNSRGDPNSAARPSCMTRTKSFSIMVCKRWAIVNKVVWGNRVCNMC